MTSYSIPRNDDEEALKYTWPGGYEVFYVCNDGETLCADCVNDPTNPIHTNEPNDGWRIVGHSHTGETDSYEQCAHCGRVIQEEAE